MQINTHLLLEYNSFYLSLFDDLYSGMKAVTEEFVHFHLPPIKNNQSTLFGLSCYRQIATSQLSQITPDMTRSSVQKSIVVLASKPVLFQIKNKLAMVTQSYFEQKDFSLVEILDVFYESLKVQLNTVLEMEDDDDNNLSAKSFGNLMDVYCSGIDLHPFIDTFKTGVLKLLKAVMIGKKVKVYLITYYSSAFFFFLFMNTTYHYLWGY